MIPLDPQLLAAVLENPADDFVRLVLADHLEERGDGERAELIRCQIEIDRNLAIAQQWASTPSDQSGGTREDGAIASAALVAAQNLQERERKLFDRLWELITPFTLLVPNKWVFRRGFIAEVHLPLSAWYGELCPDCEGDPPRLDFLGIASLSSSMCQRCQGSGRVGGHGPAIVRAAPIERIVVTDREPARSGDDQYRWVPTGCDTWRHMESATLPDKIFALLPIERWRQSMVSGRHLISSVYPTPAAAHAVVSAGLIRWAKEHVPQGDS